nr:hypothetical protein GCM10020092_046970 [Actinoplanes digitatis]
MSIGIQALPLPRWEDATVVVEPPGDEPGAWAGAPSAIVADGEVYLAYRLRLPIGEGRGISNVVARSADGLRFTVVAEIGKDGFGAESLERPALVRTPEGRWRLYVSAATPGTKHWRVDLLECQHPRRAGHRHADHGARRGRDRRRQGPGAAPRRTRLAPLGVGAPAGVLGRRRPHDDAVRDEPRRRALDLARHGARRAPGSLGRPRRADLLGVGRRRLHRGRLRRARHGGENWEERTGTARGVRLPDGSFGELTAEDGEPVGSPHAPNGLRYLSLVTMPDG